MKNASAKIITVAGLSVLLLTVAVFGYERSAHRHVIAWRKQAEQGNGLAQYMLGVSYANGMMGLKQDMAQAARWCLEAARKGYVCHENIGSKETADALLKEELRLDPKAGALFERDALAEASQREVEKHLKRDKKNR